MAYCKFCGVESSDDKNCEWCKRPLPPVPAPPATPPPPAQDSIDKVGEIEEQERKSRSAFFVSCGVLLLLASGVLFWRYQLYPVVIIISLFVTGILLARFGVIEPFSDNWVQAGVLFLLVIFLPAFVVFLGYMVYGLITRQGDSNLAWLLGAYFGVATVLEVVAFIAFPEQVPIDTLAKLRGAEALGFAAVIFGWVSAS